MKLGFSDADEAFRQELLAFLDEHTPAEVAGGRDWIGDDDDTDPDGIMVIPRWAREWQATLFDHGWMIPGYPPELGGRSCTPTQTLIFLEELARRGIPRSLHFGGYAIVGPSLLEFGDEAQQRDGPRRHPGRHRVVHRHVRAQRRVRPRQPLDPRRRRRRQLRRERPEGLDQLRHGRRRSASATCGPTRTCPSTRASRC